MVSLVFEFPLLFAFSFEVTVPWPEWATNIMQFFLLNWSRFDIDASDIKVIGFHLGLWIAVLLTMVQVLHKYNSISEDLSSDCYWKFLGTQSLEHLLLRS